MESEEPIESEWWSFTGDATGEAALASLVSRQDPRLPAGNWCLNLQGVRVADTATGAVCRRCIEVFLSRPDSQVTVWPPVAASAAVLDRMHDLLGPLPPRVTWSPAFGSPAAVRDRTVIIPATPISGGRELELYGEATGRAMTRQRLPRRTVRETVQALAELGGNAVRAYDPNGLAPIIAVAIDPSVTTVAVTVLSDPPELASPAAGAVLGAWIEDSRVRRGGWQRLISKRGAVLSIAVGSARAVVGESHDDFGSGAAVDAVGVTWTMPIWRDEAVQ